MTKDLVRTTTYFDPTLLNFLKKLAIDQEKSFYEVLNESLKETLGLKTPRKLPTKTGSLRYEEIFGPPLNLGLKKKKITRADAYE